ncbi:MAG: cytochrome b [Pseudomonadota bacterium]
MQNQEYHPSMKIIHWTMAVIIIGLLALGFYMAEFMDKESANRMLIYNLHKSFGALVLFLVVIRIFVRMQRSAPPLPDSIDLLTQALSHLVHMILYALMILMPMSGYLMSNYFGYPVHLFGLQLPMLVSPNPDLGKLCANAHEFFGFSFVAVLGLHILGVIKHRFFDKPENDVLKRMI